VLGDTAVTSRFAAGALIVACISTSPLIAQAQDEALPETEDEAPPGMGESALDPELLGDREPALGPKQPAHVIGTVGGGVGVRLTTHDEYQQDTLAPVFIDAFGAYVFEGRGTFRHGVGLGLSLNLTDDGTRQLGPGEGEQLVVAPSYLALLRLVGGEVPDVVTYGKVSLPLSVSPDLSPGLEVAFGGAYMLTAGLGIYAEVGVSAFLGGGSRGGDDVTIHPLVSGELGVLIDYELLPPIPEGSVLADEETIGVSP
jgi:hypothetical protein